jgi:hypothetical protein
LTLRGCRVSLSGEMGASMTTRIVLLTACLAAHGPAFAETWTAATKECSVEFPEGTWTLGEGAAMERGQRLLSAVNREKTKSFDLVRFDVPHAPPVKDPQFVAGVKRGFDKTGYRLTSEGFTNVNGCAAYWYAGEIVDGGQTGSTLRYALCEAGRLYQLMAESLGNAAPHDPELLGILHSFRILDRGARPTEGVSGGGRLSFKIGLVAGIVIVLLLGAAVLVRSRRDRSKGPANEDPG